MVAAASECCASIELMGHKSDKLKKERPQLKLQQLRNSNFYSLVWVKHQKTLDTTPPIMQLNRDFTAKISENECPVADFTDAL